jgi:hypothetical protein
LFVHNLLDARQHFPGMFDPELYSPDVVMVDAILLQATAGLIDALKRR